MSVSKKHLADRSLRRKITSRYLQSLQTMGEIALAEGVTLHTVMAILREDISPDQMKALKAVKYSQSKTGAKNPMLGRTGSRHPNYKGDCPDGRGYLTRVVDGVRYFVHRIVMAEALGLHPSKLPDAMAVHHINGDKTDNRLANLALTNKEGHVAIHQHYQSRAELLKLKRLSLADAARYLTSQ